MKTARCRFCDRLCCCLEHLLEHEKRHLTTEGKSQAIYEGRKCSSELSGWVDATESVLVSSRKKINFPLFCIYCKLTVGDEQELRCLMAIGPPCPLKKSHWIASFKKYIEKTRNHKILLVLEETKRQSTDRAFSFNTTLSRYKKFQDINVTKLQSNSTPRINHFTHPHITPRENSAYSVGKMKPFTTSTPQDGCEPSTLEIDISSPTVEQTPIGGKTENAPQGILSARNDQKPKGESARKVTFSCIVETTNDSSIEDSCSDNNENERKEIDDVNNKNDSGKKSGDNDHFSTGKDLCKDGKKNEELICLTKDHNSQFQNENAEQKICGDEHKVECENKTNMILEDNEKHFGSSDGVSEMEKEVELMNKGEQEAVNEKLEEGQDQEVKSRLGNEKHGESEVSSKLEINKEDRPDDKIMESSIEEEEQKSNSQDDNDMQNYNLNKESGGNSRPLTFHSEDESENESFGSRDDYIKDLKASNTGPKIRKPLHQRLSMLPYEFSAGQKWTKTSRLSMQDETIGSSENEPLVVAKTSQIERANCKEYMSLSFQDGDENNRTNTNLLSSEDNVFSDREQCNESNIDHEWGLTKIKSALSYSWGKAKELVMHPWGTKRNALDNDEENDNCAKRMKMSYSCSCSDPNSHSSLSSQWKCSQKPVRSSNYYNVSKRRPLTRMMKK